MPFRQAGSIRYLELDLLEKEGLFHAFITREKGVSPSPWKSLNLGGSGGDERNRIIENRKLVFQAFSINSNSIYDVWQVHGDNVICTDSPRNMNTPHQKADAILTNRQNIALFMLFADCVPILLYDPVQKVAGIAHAGWKGTVLKVAQKTIEQMVIRYGSQPSNILAAIGPSIGPDHYSVGSDVVQAFRDAIGPTADDFIRSGNGAVKLNLWESNRYLLEQIGVERIEIAGICTACHTDDWFSHRAEHGRTGRFGVLIGMRE
jgi:YfiH family protein